MGLNVETDQICPQKSVEQLALPWADTKCLRVRPGNVPEDSYPGVRPLLLNHFWQQSKVIILNQEHRLFGAFHLFEDGFGKLTVYLFIMFPILRAEQRASVGNMTKRPQAF